MRRLAIGLLCAGLAAPPASAVVQFQEKLAGEIEPDRALVYFVRTKAWGKGRAEPLFLYVDQEFLGVVTRNSYTYAHVQPGTRLLWNGQTARWRDATDTASSREWTFEAGGLYYFVLNQLNGNHALFTALDEEEGRAAVDGVRYYVRPTDAEIKAARQGLRERFGWIEESQERAQEPEVLIRRTTDEEAGELLCGLRRIRVGEVQLGQHGGMANVGYADDFGRALRKRLEREGFEVAEDAAADEAAGGTVGVLTAMVDKYRQDNRRGFQYVRMARASLSTLDGREVWRTTVDTSKPDIRENPLTAWSQLARRVAEQLAAACPGE